jgi:hypothetical protein
MQRFGKKAGHVIVCEELEQRLARCVDFVRSVGFVGSEWSQIMRKLAVPFFAIVVPVLMATPSSAQDPGAYVYHHRMHHYHHYYRDYSGYLDPRSGHYDPEFQRNRENFGFSGRDPSRIGGEDPSLHPVPY